MASKEFIERGSVVLVRYPFTDLSGSKLRPAVVVTPNDLLAALSDALFAFVTTSIPDKILPTDLIVQTNDPDFATTGLKDTSTIRTHKLALLHRSLVVRQLGHIAERLQQQLDHCLKKAVGVDR
jgi:mRNA interferase MazF